ncbi:MAG: hypothetical protein ACO2YZ_02545, partial [Litorivicinaceae bacterium]
FNDSFAASGTNTINLYIDISSLMTMASSQAVLIFEQNPNKIEINHQFQKILPKTFPTFHDFRTKIVDDQKKS